MTTCLENIPNYHRIFFMPSSSSSTPEEICMCYDNETIEVCTREGRGRKLIKIWRSQKVIHMNWQSYRIFIVSFFSRGVGVKCHLGSTKRTLRYDIRSHLTTSLAYIHGKVWDEMKMTDFPSLVVRLRWRWWDSAPSRYVSQRSKLNEQEAKKKSEIW